MKHLIYKLHPTLITNQKQRTGSLFHSVAIPFLKQGELDGACGPYSVWTSMLIFGFVSRNDVIAGGVFKKPKLRRAWKISKKLFMNGADEDDMSDLLKALNVFINFQEVSASMHAVIAFTIEKLEKSALVILGFETSTGEGHWMLAVGIEGLQTGSRLIPTGILCIDCEEPAPSIAPFNVRVILNATKSGDEFTQYFSSSGERQNVKLTSAFAISKRK
jgi:hypothetical protein